MTVVENAAPLSRRLTMSAILASTSLTEGTVKLALSICETLKP